MTLIVDAAPIIAAADLREPSRVAVQRVLRAERGALIIPAQVTAEVDYLLEARLGRHAAVQFLTDLAQGAYQVECLTLAEYETSRQLSDRYAGLNPGLADLSVVILARRFETRRILTFDYRHFRAITPLQGGQFQVLPADG